jgi:hypothetical protein
MTEPTETTLSIILTPKAAKFVHDAFDNCPLPGLDTKAMAAEVQAAIISAANVAAEAKRNQAGEEADGEQRREG